ncbi:dihydropteroate synthase [Natronorarus salvus]|uniref:dihydropteroate synthase n=1 Tax=Natronorarus salvus TaxID=3117733 RepID=UPI002F26C03A
MEYHEAVAFLYDLRRFRPKPGTESTADLLSSLGDPQEGLTFVQVAGSNGKGSTARMTESILREAGLRTGLYTSPHFEDLGERITVDGRRITERAVCEFAEAIRPRVIERAAEGEAPTFFEVVTAMGLWEFGRQGVDVAVLEVGIGGRLDATSVVDPVASAVTNVTLEHAGIIGDTVEEIARDKAHVAPEKRPLVTAATGEALSAVGEQAGDVLTVGESGTDVVATYGGKVNHTESEISLSGPGFECETRVPLLGAYQAENAGVAAALATQVAEVGEEELARGLRSAHWPGRFEVVGREPLAVLDGAHNPGACETLSGLLSEFEFDELHLVVGVMHEKDHRGMAEAMPTADHVITCAPDVDRGEDPAVLASVFGEVTGDVETAPSVAEAISRAFDAASEDDCVLVAGSLYVVGEARATWSRRGVPKRVDSVGEMRATATDAHAPIDDRTARSGVQRTVKVRAGRAVAQRLSELVATAGGSAARSAYGDREGIDPELVLSGTLAEFDLLLKRANEDPGVPRTVVDRIRAGVGLDGNRPRAVSDYPWEAGTTVMGILNVTPDSFYDGGRYEAVEDAVARAETMVAAGAGIVDVGGESTRPGAEPVSVEEEIERVVPVIERLSDLDVTVSVDTRKAAVGRAALEAGADVLNDVSGLSDPEMRFLAAEFRVPLVVMHSIDAPVVSGKETEYDDVVEDVLRELDERVLLAEKAGVDRSDVIVDPGLGFGKAAGESFELLSRLAEFRALGCPVMVGHSRKSMFDTVADEAEERLAPTVVATALAAERGADIVRVHDVAENVAAIGVTEAMEDGDR